MLTGGLTDPTNSFDLHRMLPPRRTNTDHQGTEKKGSTCRTIVWVHVWMAVCGGAWAFFAVRARRSFRVVESCAGFYSGLNGWTVRSLQSWGSCKGIAGCGG